MFSWCYSRIKSGLVGGNQKKFNCLTFTLPWEIIPAFIRKTSEKEKKKKIYSIAK